MPATMNSTAKEFAKWGSALFQQGLNNSHSGNMSVRTGSKILVTRHGACLGMLTGRDIVTVNLNDDKRDAQASLEVKVHRAVYRDCQKVNAVAHAHCPYATVLSLSRKSIKPIDAEGAYYLPEIPVLACTATICSDDVARLLPALLKKHRAAVVRGHGVFTAGASLEEAALLAGVVESASRIIYLHEQSKR